MPLTFWTGFLAGVIVGAFASGIAFTAFVWHSAGRSKQPDLRTSRDLHR